MKDINDLFIISKDFLLNHYSILTYLSLFLSYLVLRKKIKSIVPPPTGGGCNIPMPRGCISILNNNMHSSVSRHTKIMIRGQVSKINTFFYFLFKLSVLFFICLLIYDCVSFFYPDKSIPLLDLYSLKILKLSTTIFINILA